MVEKIAVTNKLTEFSAWLNKIKEEGYQYEVVIDHGFVNHVYVYEVDDGDWTNIKFGRIIGSKVMSYKQRAFKPVLLDGKFVENYDVKEEERKQNRVDSLIDRFSKRV